MSGPKTGSYRIIDTEAEARALFAQASAEARRAGDDYAGVIAAASTARSELGEFGSSISVPAALRPVPDVQGQWRIVKVQEWVVEARAAVAAARARLAQERAAAHAEKLRVERERRLVAATTEAIRSGVSGVPITADEVIERDPDASPEIVQQRYAEIYTKAMSQLDAEATAEDRAVVDRLAAAAAIGLPALMDLKRVHLEDHIDRVKQRCEHGRLQREERSRLRDQLAAWDAPEIAAAYVEIDSYASWDGDVDDRLRSLVAAAVVAARSADELTFVAELAADCLQDLGYEVGADFTTRIAGGGSADVTDPRAIGYAVRIGAGEDDELTFRVVRGAGPDDLIRDREVEESWCSKLAAMRAKLQERGVELSITSANDAGARPVAVVADLAPVRAIRTRNRSDQAKVMGAEGGS